MFVRILKFPDGIKVKVELVVMLTLLTAPTSTFAVLNVPENNPDPLTFYLLPLSIVVPISTLLPCEFKDNALPPQV